MEETKPKKKIWWQEKIKDLEEELETMKAGEQKGEFVQGYAEGFYDCMAKYGILSKSQRGRVKHKIIIEGPGAAKAKKRTRFAVTVPSV
jgi:hypothetical protein